MAESDTTPAIVAVPGVAAHSGVESEKWHSPRNLIAFAMVALFATVELLPFWFTVPPGRNGDLIMQGVKTVETIIMLVLAFYFATTKNSERQQETIRQQALAAPPAPPIQPLIVDPPVTIIDPKDALNAQDPDARGGAVQSAGLPASQGVRPRDDGPPE